MKKHLIVILLSILIVGNLFSQNKDGEELLSSILLNIKGTAENIALVYKKDNILQNSFTWDVEFLTDGYATSLTTFYVGSDIVGYIFASKKKEFVDVWFLDKQFKATDENTYGFILDRPDNRTIRLACKFFIYGNKPKKGGGLNRVF
jgi:hypothetical protein